MTPLDRLRRRVPVATAADLDRTGPARVLVFAGQAQRRPETQDVAVIVAELMRTRPDLTVALVAADDEDQLRARFGVGVMPAVVVTDRDRPAAVLSRVRPWTDYLAAVGGAPGATEAP